MGIAGSPDIFQAKMSELMRNLEFVWTYLDDLLTITKFDLSDHLDKKIKELTRIARSRIKVMPKNQNSVLMKLSISDIS
jgi:hypothetical protein